MRKLAFLVTLIAVTSLAHEPPRAAEGMYTLDKVESLPLRNLKKAGLELRGSEVIELSGAVVQVAGGGTGSFVSAQGLVVTNHHVAYGCIAALEAMDEHSGIADRGFVASELGDELPCPGYYLLLLVRTDDITREVREASKGLADFHARFEAEREAKERLTRVCEADGKHICKASPLNGGQKEQLSVYLRLLDVRLVYAPEKSIGKYGGDIDNWMYPRHTGDYAFLRAYVAPDGTPAAYADTNSPYKPAIFLKVSTEGIKKDSFVMVMGYPARTNRFATSAAANFYANQSIPASQDVYLPMLRVVEGFAAAYPAVGRRYARLIAGLNNATKYYGQLAEGIRKTAMLKRKQDAEKKMASKLKGKKRKELDKVMAEIERVYASYAKFHRTYYLLERMTRVGSPSLASAYTIAKWGIEKQKPDSQRKDDRFKEKNAFRLPEKSDRLELEVDFYTEAAILAAYFRAALALDDAWPALCVKELMEHTDGLLEGLKIELNDEMPTLAEVVRQRYGLVLPEDAEGVAAMLLLARSEMVAWNRDGMATEAARERRREWLKLDNAAVSNLEDPLIVFARGLERDLQALKEGPYLEVEEYLATELRRRWVNLQKAPYPDANFTLRLSFGQVKDYTSTATGETHRYVTTLAEAIDKVTGKWPFVLPEKLLEVAKAGDAGRFLDEVAKDVPINFTSTLDTTGGNSGSPVMDGRGRLVGLLFDGTSESILSDWQYLEEDQRSICMDIRYALFLALKVHGANRVIDELEL